VRSVHLLGLGCFTLAMRLMAPSAPYFVDGPAHVRAILSGRLIIQPPGYFLFNLTGYALTKAAHLTPALALNVLNISFSVLAALVFYLLASHWFCRLHALLLSLVYAASPLVWFAADVQSTYAAMTFFVPLLMLVLGAKGRFVAGCLVWAVLAGFRPSDGVFLLPWMLWEARAHPWAVRIRGATMAALGMLVWWVPTAQRFGGGFLDPIKASRSQASGLAQGAMSHPLSAHSFNNMLRTGSAMVIAWGVMLPMVIAGAVSLSSRDRPGRSWLIAITPGIVFFLFYYMADATYLSFCVAPGLLIAGMLLKDWKEGRRLGFYSLAIAASILFMMTARPIAPTTRPRALFDAYGAKYSLWSLRHQYAPRLAALLGQCGRSEVLGTCGDGSSPGAGR